MNSFNGAASALFRGGRAVSAATLEYWVHGHFQKFLRFLNGFHSGAIVCWGRHSDLGPMPYSWLLLLFEAALQDELKASTSFLHLLWSPLFCSRHFFRASTLQGEATCDMSVGAQASNCPIHSRSILISVFLIVLALHSTLPACRSCLCRSRLCFRTRQEFVHGKKSDSPLLTQDGKALNLFLRTRDPQKLSSGNGLFIGQLGT